jgi:hypothetical protein
LARVRLGYLLSAAGLVALTGSPAAYAIDRAACNDAFEAAQKLRDSGKLVETRKRLAECSRPECTIVRADCARWEAELVESVPSVVVHAHDEAAGDVVDVRVAIDGVVVATELNGRPIDVDPGIHHFTFERASSRPAETQVMIATGEKNRQLRIELQPLVTPPPAVLPPPPDHSPDALPSSTSRPVPTSVWILGGVTVVGLASFAGWGIRGEIDFSGLESSCGHSCQVSRVTPVKTEMAAADISLAIAVGAAVTGTVVYLARPSREKARGSLRLEPLGLGMAIRGTF